MAAVGTTGWVAAVTGVPFAPVAVPLQNGSQLAPGNIPELLLCVGSGFGDGQAFCPPFLQP